MASNRGDCTCHVGMAREIAALTGRTLKTPTGTPEASGSPVGKLMKVVNDEPELCPLYTARLISGVKVGPSPDWLQQRLRAIGQIPRNNLVDATNFVLFELGQPTHVFDRALLDGDTIHVRRARPGEAFLPIGEDARSVKLDENDLVIADASRAVAIAGVKGGAETAVSDTTTDILVEAAAFDQVSVRNTSRRLGIASDSSYRFERGVHPAEINMAADRLVALILEIAGGTLHAGVAADGAPLPPSRTVTMRPGRCQAILGHDIDAEQMLPLLRSLDFEPSMDGELITCQVPPRRLDVTSEIDLIEEVARAHGFDKLEVDDSMQVSVAPIQEEHEAARLIRRKLVGAGFAETISHSLISERAVEGFLDEGRSCLRVIDERAGGDPLLRPSVMPSLLQVAQRNRDRAGEHIRAFEIASIFDDAPSGHRERQVLGMIIDSPRETEPATPYRALRGCIESLGESLLGPGTELVFTIPGESEQGRDWLEPRALLTLEGQTIGHAGLVTPSIADRFDADGPIAAAELELHELIRHYPPDIQSGELPAFPPSDRDLSIVVDEGVRWAGLEEAARSTGSDHLEEVAYMTTWRGKQVGQGRKSVTMRLRFRDATRTLRHEEVDEELQAIASAIAEGTGGEIRS